MSSDTPAVPLHSACVIIEVPAPPHPPTGATITGYSVHETKLSYPGSWDHRNLDDAVEDWVHKGTLSTALYAEAEDFRDDGSLTFTSLWDGKRWCPWRPA